MRASASPDTTTPVEYELTRFNALRHGVLSRYTVLPWEDEAEYTALLDALVTEHAPHGPTEEHLVEELAGILWRKRRLRLAEAAAYRSGLEHTTHTFRDTARDALVLHGEDAAEHADVGDAIRATPETVAADMSVLDDDEGMTQQAITMLRAGKSGAYERALGALRADTRVWWDDVIAGSGEDTDDDDRPSYHADAAGLLRFLEHEVIRWHAAHRTALAHQPEVRSQAFGEALDPDRLEPLARYEVHLDRKLERTLAMLIRLQEIR